MCVYREKFQPYNKKKRKMSTIFLTANRTKILYDNQKQCRKHQQINSAALLTKCFQYIQVCKQYSFVMRGERLAYFGNKRFWPSIVLNTCNHARTVLCMTSWIVNKRPRTASCSLIISLVLFLISSSIFLAAFPLKCRRSSNTISSLACRDHLTLITWKN